MADSEPGSGSESDGRAKSTTGREEPAVPTGAAATAEDRRSPLGRDPDGAVEEDGRTVETERAATAGRGDEPRPSLETTASPPEAFQALANRARTDVLSALYEAEVDGVGRLGFSALQAATDVDTSAGFAYHLRQLVGPFVEKSDDGYGLTFAGRQVARAVAAGTFTDRASGAVDLEEPCPLCGATELSLTAADNYSHVACGDCETVLMRLPFPPAGQRTHEGDELPRAFDRRNRHRLALLSDGVCPDCGGAVETAVERPGASTGRPSEAVGESGGAPSTDVDGASGNTPATRSPAPVRATFHCRGCGQRVRSPLTLTVLDHPSVVAFYDDHGEDVSQRPLWNVGREWREGVLSTEPWCARISSRLDDEVLDLYLDANGEVRATRREPAS